MENQERGQQARRGAGLQCNVHIPQPRVQERNQEHCRDQQPCRRMQDPCHPRPIAQERFQERFQDLQEMDSSSDEDQEDEVVDQERGRPRQYMPREQHFDYKMKTDLPLSDEKGILRHS